MQIKSLLKSLKYGDQVYSFIVLGIVPGTDIRITFGAWLQIAVYIFAAVATVKIYSKIEPMLFSYEPIRVPLHASQLHQRVR